MNEEGFGRRKALQYMAMLAATAAGREFLESWLPAKDVFANGTGSHLVSIGDAIQKEGEKKAEPYSPQFFKPDEFQAIRMLTEMIIPADDKPGAREAKVAEFIDFLVYSAAEFLPSMQKEWSDGLATLNSECRKLHGKPFPECAEAERNELLAEMSAPESDPKAHHNGYDFYMLIKDTTVNVFYSSRVGLMDVLEFKGLDYRSEFPGCTHPEHQV